MLRSAAPPLRPSGCCRINPPRPPPPHPTPTHMPPAAGPTSTQMGFAIGVLKKGLSGGLLSGVLFQGPGLLILAILGWVASKVLDDPPAWLEGLVAGEWLRQPPT